MIDRDGETRECLYCKELIKPEATKCKHCGSSIAPEKAPHGGTCPYCKEQIHPEAIKCKHCKSSLVDDPQADWGCGEQGESWMPRSFRSGMPGAGTSRPQPSSTARVRPQRPINNIIVIGGPADPTDPWHCQGFYECETVCVPWLGCFQVCRWVCLTV